MYVYILRAGGSRGAWGGIFWGERRKKGEKGGYN
jgi:hypothetical protein